MDPNLGSVAKRVVEGYRWLAECGVDLPPEKRMELATSMAVAASVTDAKEALLGIERLLNPLSIRIDNATDLCDVSLSEPIKVRLTDKVDLSEPVRIYVEGSVSVDQ